MLGLGVSAAERKVCIDPALPQWLPDVTLSSLTVGDTDYCIRFWREGDETKYSVLEGDPGSVEQRPFGSAIGHQPPDGS